jgi:hypothetical protein
MLRPPYPQVKSLEYPLKRRLGFRDGLEAVKKTKILIVQGIESRYSSQ